MPFQDDVAATLAGNNGGPAAPSEAAPDTTTVSAPTTLTPPASQPASAPMQPAAATQEPSQEPGHFFKHLSHAFAGAIVGGLAGPHQTVDRYETDESGKPRAIMRPLTGRERLQRMAQAAMEGLASGSRVPPQRSAAASWAAGLGAGAEQTIGRGQQQDLLQRKQAQE